MNRNLRKALLVAAAFALAPSATRAQSQAEGFDTVPLATVLASVAKRTGKKFIVDPRVKGDVTLLQANPTALSYENLLTVLQVHGFAAVTNGEYVQVIPDVGVRYMALPSADDGKHPPAAHVTKIVPVKTMPATMLVPVLRPMLPQNAHLVAIPCTNDLLIVDTYGNIQRLEKLIKSIDRGEAYVPEKCVANTDKRSNN